jgi:hypothetical protein
MIHEDEKIAQLLAKAKEQMNVSSIQDEVVRIGSQEYSFTLQSFYDEQIFLYLPDNFMEMSEAYRKIKYPHEQRPDIIRSNSDGSINFTCKLLDHPLQDKQVEQLTQGMKKLIKGSNPSHVFYEEGVLDVEGKPIGYFEFKSSAIDESLFTLMYFLELGGFVFMGTFCCPYREYGAWRDIVYQVLQSIVIPVPDVSEEGGIHHGS